VLKLSAPPPVIANRLFHLPSTLTQLDQLPATGCITGILDANLAGHLAHESTSMCLVIDGDALGFVDVSALPWHHAETAVSR